MRAATEERGTSLHVSPLPRIASGSLPASAAHLGAWLSAALAAWPVRFVVAFVVLFLRRPQTLAIPEFWADDGPTYMDALLRGPASVLVPYEGFFVVYQRIAMWMASLASPVAAPFLANLIALLTLAAVATFASSRRLEAAVPGRWRRYWIGAALVLLPLSYEVIGSLSHIQWVLGAFLIAYAWANRAPIWELLIVAVAGLTGPQVFFIAPLYVARFVVDRRTWPRLAVIFGCCVLQLGAFAANTHIVPATRPDPVLAFVSIVEHLTLLPVDAGVLLMLLAVGSVVRINLAILLPALFVVVALPVAGEIRVGEAIDQWWEGTRYFWLSSWMLVSLVIAAPSNHIRTATLAFAVLLAIPKFSLFTFTPAGWAERSACIGHREPCLVPVLPIEGWGDRWAVRWPGR